MLLAFLAVILLGANALEEEFLRRVLNEIQRTAVECSKKEGASATDLLELAKNEYPLKNHPAKCILACFYEHYGMMKNDGTFDKQASIDVFGELKDQDADLYEKVVKTIEICHENPQILDDRCETAGAMGSCAKKEGDALGLTRESFLGK